MPTRRCASGSASFRTRVGKSCWPRPRTRAAASCGPVSASVPRSFPECPLFLMFLSQECFYDAAGFDLATRLSWVVSCFFICFGSRRVPKQNVLAFQVAQMFLFRKIFIPPLIFEPPNFQLVTPPCKIDSACTLASHGAI